MTIKREFILNEKDIKDAIKEWLSFEVDASDVLSIEFEFVASGGIDENRKVEVHARCKDEVEDA